MRFSHTTHLNLNIKFLYSVRPKAAINIDGRTDRLNHENTGFFKVVEGDNETLVCNTFSNPDVFSIEWYKNGRAFKNNTDRILLQNISVEDAGKYECRLNNQIGRGAHEVNLQVHC